MEDIRPLIPKGNYDPSEVVLIGAHMEPSPLPNPDPVDNAETTRPRPNSTDEARRVGWMRVRSDVANLLVLEVEPVARLDVKGNTLMTEPTIALIYAYGYEGHMYRLTKPRIMIVEGEGRPYESARDSDPSESLTGKLYMWRMSKHQQTISIEVESGEIEKLVLDANLPGNRSVSAYGAHMQMSHRGGKLGG